MNDAFFCNTIWYLLLLATSVTVCWVTMQKSADRKFTLAFGLAILGFTYWIEVLLLLVLNAYTYYPMLTPEDAFMDAVLGNIFSQVSVSTSALLYCVLDLKSIYIFVLAFIYFLIDVLFVKLGIYVHHWYRSVYTLFGFLAYCWFVKKWYLMLTDKARNIPKISGKYKQTCKIINDWLYRATLFFAVFAAASNSIITTQKLAWLQVFRGGFFDDISKDHTTTALIYEPILIILMICLHRWKGPLMYKAAGLLLLFVCQWGLYAAGILTVKPGWFYMATVIDLLGFYLWTIFLDRLLSGHSQIL